MLPPALCSFPHLYKRNKNTYVPLSGGILRTQVLKHFVNGT